MHNKKKMSFDELKGLVFEDDEVGKSNGLMLEMGIDIDPEKHIVSFTDDHECGVDTSLQFPLIDNKTIPGTTIYSIFRRNDFLLQDGNPLISALKGNMEDGWVIPQENKDKLLQRIRAIIDLFCQKHQSDFTIVIPSGGNINNMLRDMVGEIMGQYNPNNVMRDGVLVEMTVDEVEEEMGKPDSAFNKEYDTPWKRQMAWEKLRPCFQEMAERNNGIFSYKMVRPVKYREVITNALKFTDNESLKEMITKMPGRDILIIEDSVTYGNTTRSAVNLVRETISNIKSTVETAKNYAPTSISVLTLFSVKQYGNGLVFGKEVLGG